MIEPLTTSNGASTCFPCSKFLGGTRYGRPGPRKTHFFVAPAFGPRGPWAWLEDEEHMGTGPTGPLYGGPLTPLHGGAVGALYLGLGLSQIFFPRATSEGFLLSRSMAGAELRVPARCGRAAVAQKT